MNRMRLLLAGLVIALGGTIVIRLAGQYLLHIDRPLVTLALYAVSALLMAFAIPELFRGVERELRPAAATLVMLPTLLLDPFSCLFFATIFPNVDPAASGIFGGWMLICCAGAAAGAWLRR